MNKEQLELLAEVLNDSKYYAQTELSLLELDEKRPKAIKYLKDLIPKLDEAYDIVSKEYCKLK